MEDLASPIGAFLRDVCVIGTEHRVNVNDLYDRWKRWCNDNGRREAGTAQGFGRDLRAALPCLDVTRRREGDGRIRTYHGLAIKPGEELIPDIPFDR